MNKNNIFLTVIALVVLYGCSTYHPKYREGEPKSDFNYPDDKEIEKSFYLLGDGGYSQPGGTSAGLLAFKSFLDSVDQVGNYTLFLGDNIYPDGLVPEDHPDRERAEYRLDAQIDAIEGYDGNVIFIPGNHDWYNEGIPGLKRQREYLQESFEEELAWAPIPGNGLQIIDVSENAQLIIIDSQWYLEDWDDHPLVNDESPEIKTRGAMLLEVETELKKSQNKTTIIAMHHPLYSNGVHGGQYNFDQHLYPSQREIPVPILGSLVMLVRTSGGVSIQDLQNERYKAMVARIETIAEKWGNVVFVAGHEHSIQYIEHEHIKQIVSGSGSKASYAGLSNDGLFAYPGQGFVVLDIFEDGSSWASFYGAFGNKPKLLYQTEVFSTPEPYPIDTLPESFPETVMASVYEPEETEKGEFYESIWGDRYRELYGIKIEAEVADLNTLYGGLEPMRLGGGHQTNSLRVRDSLDREYNFRMIKKDAVQFIQTVAFKNEPVSEQFRNTLAEDVIEDFYTASHPYAFLTIPTLSDAIGVLHTNPELFYLPKQPGLGKFNYEHGGALYMIEERPEEHWMGYESFGNPNHDLPSTAGMFERLRRDEQYSVNETAYVKARIFDMLIGDWDRHGDQWRWAEIEDEEGDRVFLPIPRDRDQAFSNFDGSFFGTLRGITGFANQFGIYGEDIKDVEWFNTAAVGMDRSLLQNVGRETWKEQAEFVQENITNEVIKEAFSELPEEIQGETTQELIEKVKGRRDNIVDIALRYYDYLAQLAIVTGTNKDDFIDVTRLEDGKTRVKVTRNKDGERDAVLSNKVYYEDQTEEIWVYGLDDDDEFFVEGEADAGILVRLIGGQNNDVYTIDNGDKIKIYDHKSLPNTVEKNDGAKIVFTDDYEVNTYDKDRRTYSTNVITPDFGYNPDDGIKIGVNDTYTYYGFRRNPFTSRHAFSAGYYFGTQSFDFGYEGRFANVINDYNFAVKAHFTSPNFTRNFFGIGNETINREDQRTRDYNRTRISRVGGEIGFVKESPYGSYFEYVASFEGVEVESTENRFLEEEFSLNPEFFERKYFAGLEGTYRYDSYDDILNPTRGMKFELIAGGKMNTEQTERTFGYIDAYLGFYNALTRNRKWVLNTRVQYEANIGDGFEFYQAAVLGGNNGLRGYRQERFAGDEAFAAGTDLRYGFDQFKTNFLPFQIGVFAGYDIGRVWADGQSSSVWHDSYGGGFWVNGAQSVSSTFSLFSGSEGLRFSFGFNFDF